MGRPKKYIDRSLTPAERKYASRRHRRQDRMVLDLGIVLATLREAVIADIEDLHAQAEAEIDNYVQQLRQTYRGVPPNALRACEVNRHGSQLNYPAILKMIKRVAEDGGVR